MMRILKFNESSKYELSFDGFKEVMSEITDDLKCEYNFSEYDESKEGITDDPAHWYECNINLRDPEYPISDDMPLLDYNFLEHSNNGLPYVDDPEVFSNKDLKEWVDKIKNENIIISKMKESIDIQIEKNNEISSILLKLLKLQYRFKSFDNYKECRIGFNSFNTDLSIYFEIK